MRPLGVIGHLAHDVVAGEPPRIGGGPWHAGRALRALHQDALVVVKCGEQERAAFQRRLATLGLPVTAVVGGETTAFSFSYDAEGRREMRVDAIGEPWRPDDAPEETLRRADWVHVAPLLRDDAPPETLERLARGRRLLFDGQGLVRPRRLGPLVLDGDFDPEILRHVAILKLAEEEALTLAGSVDDVVGLGVDEIVVTLGARGCVVFADGARTSVPAQPVHGVVDPTGAGDAFAATYLSARSRGRTPERAAWRASALVAGLLTPKQPR